MKRLMVLIVALLMLVFFSTRAHAISIGFDPVSQVVQVGTPASVDLVISGLGDGIAPSLSTFDVDVSFDPTILAFSAAVFGDQLDIWGLGFNFRDAVVTSPGVLDIYEVSFDTVDDLNDYQASDFVLATLTFNTLAIGTSFLNINIDDLGDASGDDLTQLYAVDVQSGSVSAVPEPATLFLVASGLAGAGYLRRKRLFRSYRTTSKSSSTDE